jgi:SAM-dependent methyltransferase
MEEMNNMDLHDFKDVAENYDLYIDVLVGNSSFNTKTCIDFHCELAKQYGENGIADLGCGTGLILIPLLEDGHHVYGIDISQEMINVTKSKVDELFINGSVNYNLICADMRDFNLKSQISLAIVPRSGFMHILKTSDQIDVLKNINSNLTIGGILSLNTYFPSYEFIAQNGKGKVKEPFLRNSFLGANGNKIEIYNFIEYDYETQIMEGKWIFKELDENGQIVIPSHF